MASKQAVKECFDALNLTYPHHYKHLDSSDVLQLLKLWEYDFNRYSDETLKKAVMDARRECVHFPTVAELIDCCRVYESGYRSFDDIIREQEAEEIEYANRKNRRTSENPSS